MEEATTNPRGTRVPPQPEYRQVGGYRLVQELGSGGMGVVYLALNDHGRAVALKLLKPARMGDPDARRRLAREVDTLRRVRHPRVAAVLDADVDGPEPFIVTEYVPGVPLDEVVEEEGRLSRTELVQLARGLAEALTAIHGAGVVHRDLKPGNVMLVESGPVIIDFGIAHVADDARLTSTGLVMGTPGYVTPEMVEGGDVTPATDWWGWAVTLAYAASGEAPFGEGTMQQVLTRVMAGRANLSHVDPLLAPLLAGALATDPRERLSADEVMDGLTRYAHGRPALVEGAHGTQSMRLPDAEESAAYEPEVPAHDGRRQAAPPGMLAVPVTAGSDEPIQPVVWHGDPRTALPRRSAVIASLVVGLAGVAAVAPVAALLLLLAWTWVARTVDQSMTFVILRRHQMGPRRSDIPLAWVLAPWHAVSAAVVAVLTLVLPVFLGVIAAAVTVMGLSTRWRDPELLALPAAVGVGVAAWGAWWGMGGASLRRGTRTLVRRATGVAQVRWGLAGVMVLVALGAAAMAASAGGRVGTWWPIGGTVLQKWLSSAV